MKIVLSVSGDEKYQMKLDKFIEAKKAFDKALRELQDAQPHYSFVTNEIAEDVESFPGE